jgi:hypothetical protein
MDYSITYDQRTEFMLNGGALTPSVLHSLLRQGLLVATVNNALHTHRFMSSISKTIINSPVVVVSRYSEDVPRYDFRVTKSFRDGEASIRLYYFERDNKLFTDYFNITWRGLLY